MREILKSKLSLLHFSIVFLGNLLLFSVIWFLIILSYWFVFGEGAKASEIDELPINVLIENFLPLIIVLFLCAYMLFNNYKKKKLSLAKSYLLNFILISMLYLFKHPIAVLIVDLFN